MSANFTPSDAVDMSNERNWPSSLGMLDWDKTNIVFTKRSLIEFLKNVQPLYTGITVDPNFTNIAKLPRYAKFGTITSPTGPSDAENTSEGTPQATDNANATLSSPTHRLRQDPGRSHSNIFGYGDDDDALASAPPKTSSSQPLSISEDHTTKQEAEPGTSSASGFKPTRRVRARPGGESSISSIFQSDDDAEEFKPTRRVRQGPGGQDHLNDLFG